MNFPSIGDKFGFKGERYLKHFAVAFMEITNISFNSVFFWFFPIRKILCTFTSGTIHQRAYPSSLTKRKPF